MKCQIKLSTLKNNKLRILRAIDEYVATLRQEHYDNNHYVMMISALEFEDTLLSHIPDIPDELWDIIYEASLKFIEQVDESDDLVDNEKYDMMENILYLRFLEFIRLALGMPFITECEPIATSIGVEQFAVSRDTMCHIQDFKDALNIATNDDKSILVELPPNPLGKIILQEV